MTREQEQADTAISVYSFQIRNGERHTRETVQDVIKFAVRLADEIEQNGKPQVAKRIRERYGVWAKILA